MKRSGTCSEHEGNKKCIQDSVWKSEVNYLRETGVDGRILKWILEKESA
jgi:hypothetical protein